MKKKIKWLSYLLIGSVALNLLVLFRLTHIQGEMRQNHRHLTQWAEVIDRKMNGFDRELHQFRVDSRWIRGEEFIPQEDLSSREKIHLDLDWSFRELEERAPVSLRYGVKGDGTWQEVKANRIDENQYRASLILSPEQEYEYQIIAGGTVTRVGDPTVIPTSYHQPSPADPGGIGISTDQEGYLTGLHLTVFQPGPVYFDFYRFVAGRVYLYEGNELRKTLPLGRLPYHPSHQEGLLGLDIPWGEIDVPTTSAYLEIEYGDGTIDRREIFPNNRFESPHENI